MNKEFFEEFKEIGYCIIDDYIPIEIANNIYEIFNNESEWEFIDQIRKNHYEHVFKTESPFLPDSGEYYSAKFNRSKLLEENQLIKDVFEKYFIPLMKSKISDDIKSFDVRCYKLDTGNHYRTHIDDYAGEINLIYYVNNNWKWDWGGILNIYSDSNPDFIKSIFPKFNRIVLINNKVFRSPHSVSCVEEFAHNPRYSIVSFNK
jgi:Rps23 Pro-64 3,4-dihydroxylase Tpa1-like proline 4-hydroxylase